MRKSKYSLTFKIETLLSFYQNKVSIKQFCKDTKIPRTTFIYWKKQYENKNLIEPKKSSGRRTKITNTLKEFIENEIRKQPFQKISDLRNKCIENGFNISLSLVYFILKYKLGYSYKKSKFFIRPDKYEVDDVYNLIEKKQLEMSSVGMDNTVSIDELPIYKEMHPLRGWCKKGEVLYQRKKRMISKKYSLIMAVSNKKVIGMSLYEGGINAGRFGRFLSRKVIPRIGMKDSLLMDNVSFHKTKKIKAYLEKKGIKTLFTVPYTPDLNPIENAFSIIKNHIRRSCTTNIDKTKKAILGAIPLLTSTKLENMYKRSFGYTDFKIQRF